MTSPVKSWQCGKNVEYNMCLTWDGIDCFNNEGSFGAGNARSTNTKESGDISAILLRSYDANMVGAVTLFNNNNCKGDFSRLYASSIVGEVMSYDNDEISDYGVDDNSVSSVMVPFGYSLTVHSWENFGGFSTTVKGQAYLDAHN